MDWGPGLSRTQKASWVPTFISDLTRAVATRQTAWSPFHHGFSAMTPCTFACAPEETSPSIVSVGYFLISAYLPRSGNSSKKSKFNMTLVTDLSLGWADWGSIGLESLWELCDSDLGCFNFQWGKPSSRGSTNWTQSKGDWTAMWVITVQTQSLQTKTLN